MINVSITAAPATFATDIEDEGVHTRNTPLMESLSPGIDADSMANTTGDGVFSAENMSVATSLVFTSTSFTGHYQRVVFWVISTIGLLGNALVIFVFLRSPDLRHKITNRLIVNQSVIDLLASVFVGLNHEFDDFGWVQETGPIAYYFCKIWLSKFVLWGLMFVSTLNLIALTFERYFALIHPMLYKRYFTTTGTRVVISVVWITGLGFQSWNALTTELKGTICSTWTKFPSQLFQRIFGLIANLVVFIIPACLMCGLYIRIALKLHRERKMADASLQRERNMARARFVVIRTLIWVALGFFTCWILNVAYSISHNLGVPIGNFTGPMYHFSVFAAFANCCINPFIYVFSFDAFRKSLKQAICCRVQKTAYTPNKIGTRVVAMSDNVRSPRARMKSSTTVPTLSAIVDSREADGAV